MNCQNISVPCAWIEGKTTVKELIFEIAEKIQDAQIPTLDGDVKASKWKILYKERAHDWVEYSPYIRRVRGIYKHTDGKKYYVVKLPDLTESRYRDPEGYIWEIISDAPYDVDGYEAYFNYRTGKKINVEGFNSTQGYIEIPNSLAVLIDKHPNKLEKDFANPWEKYQAYIVRHSRESYDGKRIEDKEWNQYEIVASMPDDWTYNLWKNGFNYYRYSYYSGSGSNREKVISSKSIPLTEYYTDHTYFDTAYFAVPARVVLQCNTEDGKSYNVYFEKALNDNNHITVRYGFDIKYMKNIEGTPEESYLKACDLDSIGLEKTPEIVDELEAYKAFERQLNRKFAKGELEFSGKISPESFYFFSRNSTLSWLPNKMRSHDSLVKYQISLTNDRAIIILEGDANYDPESTYQSFAYIGKFNALDPEDCETNFAVTVGMGDVSRDKTGFVFSDIDKEGNPAYAKYGRFTSNGMDTVSVYRGITNLPYQEYFPSFLTHLPNYPNIGTIPENLRRLVLADHRLQGADWTDHHYSSPIYLVHPYEGYRGYLDGVVALCGQHILDGDELEWKVGDFIEIYKYFEINSPISFLDRSPSPGKTVSLAVLKGIEKRSDDNGTF